MNVTTKSQKIKQIINEVLEQLPKSDFKKIDSFVTRISVEIRKIGMITFQFCPLVIVKTTLGSQIRISLPNCKQYSLCALKGMFAREIGKAFYFSNQGPGWKQKYVSYDNEIEDVADRLVIKWKLTDELLAMKREVLMVTRKPSDN